MENLKSKIKFHNELSKKLSVENGVIYTNVVLYLRMSKLSDVDAEDAIGDILEMLIDAQERGQDANDIFGNDIKIFCDNIINSYGSINKTAKIRELFQIIFMCIVITTVYNYIFDELPKIIKGNQSWLTFNYSLSMLINSIAITVVAYFLVIYIGKTAFKKGPKGKSGKFVEFLKYFVFSMILFGALVLSNLYFKDVILFTTSIYIVIPTLILIYIIQYFMVPKTN